MDSRAGNNRSKKIEALIELVLQAIKGGASWREAMMRIDGSYYKEQVKLAAQKYLDKQPPATIHIKGYRQFLESTKGE